MKIVLKKYMEWSSKILFVIVFCIGILPILIVWYPFKALYQWSSNNPKWRWL